MCEIQSLKCLLKVCLIKLSVLKELSIIIDVHMPSTGWTILIIFTTAVTTTSAYFG